MPSAAVMDGEIQELGAVVRKHHKVRVRVSGLTLTLTLTLTLRWAFIFKCSLL
jgi:hypothetical protein